MPKITYQEFRPGKWVKLADGKVVGPATAEEVAAWKQEKAAPIRIWEDVVKVAKPPTVKPAATTAAGGGKESRQPTIWEDIVKRTKPVAKTKDLSRRPQRSEGPPAAQPRKEDTEWAEQAQIWQDVVKRVKKPGRELEREPATEARARPQKKEPPGKKTTTRAAAPKPEPPAKDAKASRTRAKTQAPAQRDKDTVPKVAGGTTQPSAQPRSAAKQALPSKPALGAKTIGKEAAAGTKPAKEKTTQETTAAPPKTRSVARAAPHAKAQIPEDDSVHQSAERAATIKPPRTRATVSRKATAAVAAGAARTRRARTAEERPNQLYLWIVATQSDDLLTAVRTGLARYQERFSHPAEVVLCHSNDLPALEGAKLPIDLREGKSLAPRNFWIGLK